MYFQIKIVYCGTASKEVNAIVKIITNDEIQKYTAEIFVENCL